MYKHGRAQTTIQSVFVHSKTCLYLKSDVVLSTVCTALAHWSHMSLHTLGADAALEYTLFYSPGFQPLITHFHYILRADWDSSEDFLVDAQLRLLWCSSSSRLNIHQVV